MNWDELRRLMLSRITESGLLAWKPHEVGCTLRDHTIGSVVFLRIEKSTRIHSIVDDGTFRRLDKGNKQLTAPEINELSFARGTITAESQLESVDFDLLDTDYWRAYAQQRRLTAPIAEAMLHVGLAKALGRRPGIAHTRRGAALRRGAKRVVGEQGRRPHLPLPGPQGPDRSEHQPAQAARHGLAARSSGRFRTPLKPLSGIGERASNGAAGFEIVQRYPVRVIKEAITNAVHRDYHSPPTFTSASFPTGLKWRAPACSPGR